MAHTLHRFLATASSISTMETKPQLLKGNDPVLSSLNAAIGALDLASDATSLKSAKDAFKSASILLTTIRVGFLLSAFFDCQLMYVGFDDQ